MSRLTGVCRECSEPSVNSGLCRSHYNAYMRAYKARRHRARREQAIRELGGCCVDCGTTDNLEFDHVDASTKLLDIGSLSSYSEARLQAELRKCVLRCVPCHVTKTVREDLPTVTHGGGLSGKKNCPCPACRARKAEYQRRYRRPAA